MGIEKKEIKKEKKKKKKRRRKEKKNELTYRYIQLEVSRLGLPDSHSGAKVIQPRVTCQPQHCGHSETKATAVDESSGT